MKDTKLSKVRIPLYRKKEVEIYVCIAPCGDVSLEINNTAAFPRLVALSNQWTCDSQPKTLTVAAGSLQKMPWPVGDLRKIEVHVCDSVADTMRMN